MQLDLRISTQCPLYELWMRRSKRIWWGPGVACGHGLRLGEELLHHRDIGQIGIEASNLVFSKAEDGS
jgi:hypothetical protein